MGRLVYISVPNYIGLDLGGTHVRGGEYFQNVADIIHDCLRDNGIDSYIASSALRDDGDRVNEAESMYADVCIEIDIASGEAVGEKGSSVYYVHGDEYSKSMAALIAKNMSKISRKAKYTKVPHDHITDNEVVDVYLALKNESALDADYLVENSVKIGEAIAKSVCQYFGIKWNYRPKRDIGNQFMVYIPPIGNIIKARTIASSLKKNEGVQAKVVRL